LQAYRAAIFHLLEDPAVAGPEAHAYHPDGLLLVDGGHILACGDYRDLAPRLGDTPVETLPGRLITPGFIDLHIHFPQIDAIAAHGLQLLDWLNRHIFPAEAAFADPAHAAVAAGAFVDELLRNGTTTAMVFGSSHRSSIEALFAQALARDMRLIAGKTLMDRDAPDAVRDTLEGGRRDTLELIGAGAPGLSGDAPVRGHQHRRPAGDGRRDPGGSPRDLDADPPGGEHRRGRARGRAVSRPGRLSWRL
jgi:guanine deaminase